MLYTYCIREDIIHNENGEPYIVYGIEVISSDGMILESFPNVFFDKQKAENLAKLCNDGSLDLVHLQNIVEDAVTEEYSFF